MTGELAVGILGGTGFGAGELLRLLCSHPANVVSVVSSSMAGKSIADAHPNLKGFYEQSFDGDLNWDALVSAERAVIFSALPHGQSASTLAELYEKAQANDVAIIDLSGDFRLRDLNLHKEFYPESSAQEALRAQFVYGLSELDTAGISSATAIANPGCLATAAILAVAPIVNSDFSGAVAFDAKTGSSGSGKSLKQTTQHATRRSNYCAYKVHSHQHEPEVLQALGVQDKIQSSFVAQSMPTVRGIYLTAHFFSETELDGALVIDAYQSFYEQAPFVRVLEQAPQLIDVVGTNFCDVYVSTKGKQGVAIATIDNLVKGMAGQAIQNMNLICGLEETTGLLQPSLRMF